MTRHDLRHLEMWWAVRRHLDRHSNIWNGNEPFSDASRALAQTIGQAKAVLEVQAVTSKGIAAERILLKRKAINQTLAIAKSARVYAKSTGNSELLSAVNYGRAALVVLSQHELVAQLRTIIAAARVEGEALRKFGVTPEDCDAALEASAAMEAAQSFVRTAITGRKAVTMNVPAVMAAGREALRMMDDLIHLFEVAEPEFVSGYKTARKVVHAASRPKDDPSVEAA